MAAEKPGRQAMDGTAWAEFCDALKRAGAVIQRKHSPNTPLDRAEGYRYLTRLTRLALEKFVEFADPVAPQFYRLSHETGKIGCDNPDSFYQNAAITGQYEYKIFGTRGTVAYLGFGTYYGNYGSKGRSGCSGYLDGRDLIVAPDGRFEIILSKREHPANWLRLAPDTSMLIVRQNILDRDTEQLAQLRIERLGVVGTPEPLSVKRFSAGLTEAARFVNGTAALFADWAEGFARGPNQLQPLDPTVTTGAHGDPNIFYYMGYWELGRDEALVIEVDPPECEYWNFQLNNYWMESLDYRYHRIHYNKHTAKYLEDGSVRLVVAHKDPGQPNWVETCGHSLGTMGLRWVRAKDHPQPRSRVVKITDLAR